MDTFAQSTTDDQLKHKTVALTASGINLQLVYYVDCIGGKMRVIDDRDTICHPYDVKYLLWQSGNFSYLQRFDECRIYQPKQISNRLTSFIKTNYNKIRTTKLHAPGYDVVVKGKKETYEVYTDHSCHNYFQIRTATSFVKKDLDNFYLETKLVDDRHANKYYQRNQASILNKLKNLMEQEVQAYKQL